MLEGLRRQYDAPLVCAMSGNFVQRGDAAVARKHARGEMAVRCGADLVLELPTPWAMASAERFAAGGVALLASTGVVSHLAFGSECGDLTALQAAEAALSQPELIPRIRQLLAQGMAYAPARQQAAEELGAPPQMLSRPNDILAIEYLKALRRQKAPMEPLAVLRQGAGHDGAPSGDTASASYLRAMLRSGRTDEALSYLPAPAAQVLRRELALGQAPADLSYCHRAILARLRQLREEDFLPYDGGKEGLYPPGLSGGTHLLLPGGAAGDRQNQALPHLPAEADAAVGVAGCHAPGGRHPLSPCAGRQWTGPGSSAADAAAGCTGTDPPR